jgi:hypothetical protein
MHVCEMFLSHVIHYRHGSTAVVLIIIIRVIYKITNSLAFPLTARTSIENTRYTFTT